MKLLPSFYQVGGPALTAKDDATAYLLPAGDALYLIDCGTPGGYPQLMANIRRLGFDPARITRVLGTHGHFDHVGAAARLAEELGAALYLHEADREQVEMGDDVRTTAALLYGAKFPKARVHRLLADGDVIHVDAGELTVLHTPGHSLGSCCFVLRHVNGVTTLIAGDTLHGGFSPLIGSDEAMWRVSLDKLCALSYDYYTMGHCNAVLFADADARLDCLRRSFANYYNPWFKTFSDEYRY